MEQTQLKNILWCYEHTGNGQTIMMKNVFSKDAVGGAFYQTENGWVCTGKMSFQANGIVVFSVWMDDEMTKHTFEGVKEGNPFKLLVYEGNEWKEITFTKVKLAIGGIKTWTPELFKAKAWNMMVAEKVEHVIKSPVDLNIIVNPDLIQNMPVAVAPEFINFNQTKRYVAINMSSFWCSYYGYEVVGMPSDWKINRSASGALTIHKYSKYLGSSNQIEVSVKFKPFNENLPMLIKKVIVNIV